MKKLIATIALMVIAPALAWRKTLAKRIEARATYSSATAFIRKIMVT